MQARPSSAKLIESGMPEQNRAVYEDAKQAASFWLGIICYEEGDYPVAIDYFSKRTLEAAPDGVWTPAAQYNLGRAYEATGQLDKAIELYEDDDSPQRQGNLLRARRLKTRLAAAAASAASVK
jgi:tetratricopeptide (TPR) repeat protein